MARKLVIKVTPKLSIKVTPKRRHVAQRFIVRIDSGAALEFETLEALADFTTTNNLG
tara:strand:+ start:443 stop:613 length:171 start_codon:yes stop_codon:yes gene_type:complete